tara:strand:- start:10361 stop:10912 length:552 start_codon:yes stop_codon:yes gene_type:complete
MAILGIGNAAALVGSVVTDGTTHASNVGVYGKWTMATEEGISYLYHGELDPSDTDAMLVSPGIKGTWVNGKKIVVGFNITTAGANVTSDFHIEGSMDGKNWVMIGSSLDDDIEPDGTGVQLYTADLSDYTLSWYRLVNNDGLDDQTNIKLNFLVSGINSEYAEGLGIEGVSDSFIGGVGVDPS